jgi:hypothetical protein
MEFDHGINAKPKTIEGHLQNICKRIWTKWPNSNAFLDTYLINDTFPEGVTCIEYIFRLLGQKGIVPLPTIRISTPDSIINAITTAISLYGIKEVGLRVFISDITSSNFDENIQELLSKIQFQSKDCHLIMDLNDADFTNADDFSDGINQALSNFPDFKNWKSFSICGGSFPTTNLVKAGVNQIPRGEWNFFKKLVEKQKGESFERPINYGDYGIVAPGYFKFDPQKMSRSANIRYTHNDIWYVVKGKALKKPEDFKQYFAQAKDVLNSGFYLGETFSDGDSHLKKCSNGETSTGNPNVWNRVGFNHHFTKVVFDLFASSPAA